jgi:hypothetical protein
VKCKFLSLPGNDLGRVECRQSFFMIYPNLCFFAVKLIVDFLREILPSVHIKNFYPIGCSLKPKD